MLELTQTEMHQPYWKDIEDNISDGTNTSIQNIGLGKKSRKESAKKLTKAATFV